MSQSWASTGFLEYEQGRSETLKAGGVQLKIFLVNEVFFRSYITLIFHSESKNGTIFREAKTFCNLARKFDFLLEGFGKNAFIRNFERKFLDIFSTEGGYCGDHCYK